MNAIFFNQTGDPQEVLAIGEFDRPSPGPGEILVKVHAASINPADILFIQGKYRIKPEFPQIAGLEAAGVIESVGAGVLIFRQIRPHRLSSTLLPHGGCSNASISGRENGYC